jgi:hypothetical protein
LQSFAMLASPNVLKKAIEFRWCGFYRRSISALGDNSHGITLDLSVGFGESTQRYSKPELILSGRVENKLWRRRLQVAAGLSSLVVRVIAGQLFLMGAMLETGRRSIPE